MCVYEYSKCQAVDKCLELVFQGIHKSEDSENAAKLYWYQKVTPYRSRMIQRYADEYIETGSIKSCFKNKHSKRRLPSQV